MSDEDENEERTTNGERTTGELVPVKKGMGAYGCYYFPRVPCHDLTASEMRRLDEVELLGSKVQRRSSSLDQEIEHVRKLLLSVPQHHLYYVLPQRVCNLTELKDVQDCEKLHPKPKKGGGGAAVRYEEELKEALDYDRTGQWVNMLMRNIDHGLSVGAYLRSIAHTERWSSLLRLYKHLTEGVELMVGAGVGMIHWDLHSDNVMVDARTGIPYMIDFGLSIDAHKGGERSSVARSFEMDPYHYRWPMETQFMMWAHRGSESVDAVIDRLTSHMRFFDICSVGFKERYVAGAKELYRGFTRAHGRSDLLWLGWHTWDGYALAVLFLQYICSMYSSGFYVNNRMLRDLFRLLLENVHYDWRRRPTASETLVRLREMIDRSYTPEEYLLSREYPSMNYETGCPDM